MLKFLRSGFGEKMFERRASACSPSRLLGFRACSPSRLLGFRACLDGVWVYWIIIDSP
jgi:hypothetical protein